MSARVIFPWRSPTLIDTFFEAAFAPFVDLVEEDTKRTIVDLELSLHPGG